MFYLTYLAKSYSEVEMTIVLGKPLFVTKPLQVKIATESMSDLVQVFDYIKVHSDGGLLRLSKHLKNARCDDMWRRFLKACFPRGQPHKEAGPYGSSHTTTVAPEEENPWAILASVDETHLPRPDVPAPAPAKHQKQEEGDCSSDSGPSWGPPSKAGEDKTSHVPKAGEDKDYPSLLSQDDEDL
jgi:hypothetical protein